MLDKEKIVAAFSKMDFGEAFESTQLAEEWLERKNINLETDVSKEKLEKHLKPWRDANILKDIVVKYNFYKEITEELKKNISLIVQLEMLVRGFSYKDAMKSITLFLDCLLFYSGKNLNRNYYNWKNDYIPENMTLSYIGSLFCYYDFFGLMNPLYVDPKLAIVLLAMKEIIAKQCDKYQVNMHIAIRTGQSLIKNEFLTGRTPLLVFNGADLDSACESIVSAAFSDQGIMPWSVNTVFVQEDILAEVVMKLKHRLSQVKIGSSVDKQVDFSVPLLLGDYKAKFAEILAAAKAKGVEVFQPDGGEMIALCIGGKVFNNNVLPIGNKKQHVPFPYLNVMAFRSIKEAVALCNNQQQNFAAGVWANDVGLVNEIVHGLDVGTVWVNTHGVFHPSVPFYFERYYYSMTIEECDHLTCFYEIAKAAQPAWAKKSDLDRINVLQNFAGLIGNKLDTKNDSVQWMFEELFMPSTASNVRVYGAHELKQFSVATGVVGLSNFDDFKTNFAAAVAALAVGNTIVLVQDNLTETCKHFCDEMAAAMPGVFQIVVNKDPPYLDPLIKRKSVWTAIGENYV